MSDLGLDALTGDQLVELLQEACQELARRDPYVRNIAQATIFTAAEKLKVKRQCVKQAVDAVRADYKGQLLAESKEFVRRGLIDGSIRLFSPEQEARACVDGVLAAKLEAINEVIAKIESGEAAAHNPKKDTATSQMRMPRPMDYDSYNDFSNAYHNLQNAAQNYRDNFPPGLSNAAVPPPNPSSPYWRTPPARKKAP